MKYLLVASFSIFLTQTRAQTALIAHKSHSGSTANFVTVSTSNFGIVKKPHPEGDLNYPKYELKEITEFNYFEVLNDSVVIKRTSDENQLLISIDTLSNNRKLNLEEFKTANYLQDEVHKTERILKQHKPQTKKEETGVFQTNKKQNPPSFLLIFFAVSAVGMIIMRLFRSREQVSTPIQ